MLHGFIVEQNSLHLSLSGGTPAVPLHFSVATQTLTGSPISIIATDGSAYVNKYVRKPKAIIMKTEAGLCIKKTYTLDDVRSAEYILSCEGILLHGGKPNWSEYLDRKLMTGLGILRDGRVLLLADTCAINEMVYQFKMLGAIDAVILSRDNAPYVKYNGGRSMLGTNVKPVTVLEASSFKTLEQPVVVIEAGHGGKDPGACGNGLQEKDITLYLAQGVRNYLAEHYVGTYVLLRDNDATIDLNDRPKMANSIKADAYLSIHVNASKDTNGNGFETHIYVTPSMKSIDLQKAIHNEAMGYLRTLGIKDRGVKRSNFCVVRETECPAVLIETLFISNKLNAQLLTRKDVLDTLAVKYAVGMVKGMGLQLKATTTTPTPEQLYTVQVGAYASREIAEGVKEKLKVTGYDAFVKQIK